MSDTSETQFISRSALLKRWQVSKDTLRRSELSGHLHPVRLNPRVLRYKLAEVLAIEEGVAK